jgi:hypothetical protein
MPPIVIGIQVGEALDKLSKVKTMKHSGNIKYTKASEIRVFLAQSISMRAEKDVFISSHEYPVNVQDEAKTTLEEILSNETDDEKVNIDPLDFALTHSFCRARR